MKTIKIIVAENKILENSNFENRFNFPENGLLPQSQVDWVEKLSGSDEENIEIVTTSIYILEGCERYFKLSNYKVIFSDGIIEKDVTDENDGNFIYELFAKPMKQLTWAGIDL